MKSLKKQKTLPIPIFVVYYSLEFLWILWFYVYKYKYKYNICTKCYSE